MMRTTTATPQSTLHAGGEHSSSFIELTTVLVLGGGVIFAGVMLLLAISLSKQRLVNTKLWLIGGGIAFPAVVLCTLFFYSEWLRPAWRPSLPANALVVTVTAHMWWWDVSYQDTQSRLHFVTANEIRLPLGRPVYFALTSEDVIHSFWVPALGGKMDMVPGRIQHLLITPVRQGQWRGQCAEFCGTQHALMALDVIVSAPAEYEAWAKAQAQPAVEAELPHPGRYAFMSNHCNFCHNVRGMPDADEVHGKPRLGPDLTHIASRHTLAAGALPNTMQNMHHWITNTQEVKPDARMPSGAERIPQQELEDIAKWLSMLK